MPLVDLTTNLSDIKKLFGSKSKTAGKTGSFPHKSLEETPNTGPNATSVEKQSLEDRFNAGVPGPNRNFGNLVNQTTPTVPTTMEGTPAKTTPIIQSNWTVFQTIADRSPRYPKLEENKGEYQYFKQYQSALDPNARGTYGSAWKQGKVVLSADSTPPYDSSTIVIDQYSKFSRPYIFKKGLLGDFTSFPDIPTKTHAIPPSILTFPRGGPVLTVKRGLKDVERHAKWLLSGKGIIWGLTQVGLQILNTRPETRIWNPLSLGSIIPAIHIPRHLDKGLDPITTQKFGDSIYGGMSYTEAEDYKGNDSRLIQFLDTYVNTGGVPIKITKKQSVADALKASGQLVKEKLFGFTRQTPGQLIYLIPGRGGIFGQIPGAEVRSQYHKTLEPIHQSPKEPQVPHANLGNYKTLAYGDLKKLDELDQRRGSITQFDRDDKSYLTNDDPISEPIEKRYKLGDPGKPGLERSSRIAGVNATKGDKLDTVDLLNVQGYIPPKGAENGAMLADGATNIHINDFIPESGDYPDLVPLHFYDTINKAWILFRAYIGKFNDTISPAWGNTQYAGRPVPQYYYQNTERKISFDFKVAAQSGVELAPLWQKLNYLVGLCYPTFTGKAFPTMVNPFIKLTLGDVYHHVPGFLTQLTMTPIDNIPWETVKDAENGLARVPMGMNVSLDFTYVGDSMPSSKSPYHFLNNEKWIDHSDSYWSTEPGTAYPARLKEK